MFNLKLLNDEKRIEKSRTNSIEEHINHYYPYYLIGQVTK
jgi:hypothetical protein